MENLVTELIASQLRLIGRQLERAEDAVESVAHRVLEVAQHLGEHDKRLADLEQETRDHCQEIDDLFVAIRTLAVEVLPEEEEEASPEPPDLDQTDLRV